MVVGSSRNRSDPARARTGRCSSSSASTRSLSRAVSSLPESSTPWTDTPGRTFPELATRSPTVTATSTRTSGSTARRPRTTRDAGRRARRWAGRLRARPPAEAREVAWAGGRRRGAEPDRSVKGPLRSAGRVHVASWTDGGLHGRRGSGHQYRRAARADTGLAARQPASGLDGSGRRGGSREGLGAARDSSTTRTGARASARRATPRRRGRPSTAPGCRSTPGQAKHGERRPQPLPVPRPFNIIGIGMGGPTIITWGTEEHEAAAAPAAGDATRRSGASCSASRARAPTSPASRPAPCATATSGSSTARRSGRRSPTSSKWGMLVARTNPDVPKHKGLTYFVVDMEAPGVEVRPLVQITGDAEFNEVFFDDVRIPDSMRLGPEGEGWRVAITTLMNERVSLSGAGSVGGDAVGGSPVAAPHRPPPAARPTRSSASGSPRPYIESRLIRLNNQRAADRRKSGAEAGPEGSITKLQQAEFNQRLQKLAVDLEGASGIAWEGGGLQRDDLQTFLASDRGDHTSVVRGFLRAQANTIEGGTSDIMRNILGERVLGPAEGARYVPRAAVEGRAPLGLTRAASRLGSRREPIAAELPAPPRRHARGDLQGRVRGAPRAARPRPPAVARARPLHVRGGCHSRGGRRRGRPPPLAGPRLPRLARRRPRGSATPTSTRSSPFSAGSPAPCSAAPTRTRRRWCSTCA